MWLETRMLARTTTKSEPSKHVCAGDATAVSTCACDLGLKPAPAASLCFPHAQTRLPRARAPCPRQRRRARGPRQRLCRVLRAPPRRARSALRAVRLRPLALPPCSGHAKSATKSEPSKRVYAGDATAVSTCACNLGLKPAPAASLCSSALQRACQISEKKIPEKTSRLAPTRRDAPEGAGRL